MNRALSDAYTLPKCIVTAGVPKNGMPWHVVNHDIQSYEEIVCDVYLDLSITIREELLQPTIVYALPWAILLSDVVELP